MYFTKIIVDDLVVFVVVCFREIPRRRGCSEASADEFHNRKVRNAFLCKLLKGLTHVLTLKVLVATIDSQLTIDAVEGDGGCRVGEVRAGTTSPIPDHKGFKLL